MIPLIAAILLWLGSVPDWGRGHGYGYGDPAVSGLGALVLAVLVVGAM